MTTLYNKFFFEQTSYYGAGPLLDISKLPNVLYAMGFNMRFLGHCENSYYWRFDTLFPALKDGSFYEDLPSGSPINDGHTMLLNFATNLCGIIEQNPSLKDRDTQYFYESLLDDGFQLVGRRLIETTQDIIPEPQEISAVESLIRISVHDGRDLLLQHFLEAHQLYSSGNYHPSIGEWRSFLEETLRGVWRLTRARRPEYATFSDIPSMKDLLDFLRRSGFFASDEHPAFSSTWGFLCAGGHPGISEKDDAHLSMILALTFGHAALLKLERWAEGGFIRF